MRSSAEQNSDGKRGRYTKCSEAEFCITRYYANFLFDNSENLYVMQTCAIV